MWGGEGAAAVEEIADGGAFGDLEGAGGLAELIAKEAEGEKGDAHALFIIREPGGWTDGRAISDQRSALRKAGSWWWKT